MPWFHNNSDTTTSVEVGNGEVVSVHPFGVVFIENSSVGKRDVKKLIGKGVLQRTANPNRGNKPIQVVFEQIAEPVKIETDFSASLVEIEGEVGSNVPDSDSATVKPKRSRRTKTK
jgi:hypothetical protein